MDTSNPCRPILEVDALTRDGDLDQGPLLVTVEDYARMAGADVATDCLRRLREQGRIVEHQGTWHVAFPTWVTP